MVHWNTASCDKCTPNRGSSLAGPNWLRYPRTPSAISLGFRIFPGVGGRAMLGATPALDACEGLQRNQLRDILAGIQAEIFVTNQWRNLAERVAFQEHRHRTQRQVQMLGMRDQGQKRKDRKRVRPPQQAAGFPAIDESGEIRDHQQEDQQRDDTGFNGQRAQPFRPDHKPAESQSGDPDGHRYREHGCYVEIERTEESGAVEKTEPHAFGEIIDGNQPENAKSPEHQRMGDARERPLGNHFPLQHHFPEEIADAARNWLEVKIGVFLGLPDHAPDFAKSPPKAQKWKRPAERGTGPTPARSVGAPTASVAQA